MVYRKYILLVISRDHFKHVNLFFNDAVFDPIGQATGEEMDKHKPTLAYIVNIFSSLAGIWLFSLVSFLQMPPLTWFLIFLIGILTYFYICGRHHVLDWTLAVGLVVAVGFFNQGAFWSPYSRLSLSEHNLSLQANHESIKSGYILQVQQVFYQSAINLSDSFVAKWGKEIPDLSGLAFSYNLPYRLVAPGSSV